MFHAKKQYIYWKKNKTNEKTQENKGKLIAKYFSKEDLENLSKAYERYNHYKLKYRNTLIKNINYMKYSIIMIIINHLNY